MNLPNELVIDTYQYLNTASDISEFSKVNSLTNEIVSQFESGFIKELKGRIENAIKNNDNDRVNELYTVYTELYFDNLFEETTENSFFFAIDIINKNSLCGTSVDLRNNGISWFSFYGSKEGLVRVKLEGNDLKKFSFDYIPSSVRLVNLVDNPIKSISLKFWKADRKSLHISLPFDCIVEDVPEYVEVHRTFAKSKPYKKNVYYKRTMRQ